MNSINFGKLLNNIKNFGGENFFLSDDNNHKKWRLTLYFCGVLLIFLYYLPQFININETEFRIHDYLEQDFVNIHLNAKYLYSPSTLEIGELFGGTFRGSIQHHGIFYVLLYKIIQGSAFLVVAKLIVSIFGFSGIYLLFDRLYSFNKTICFYVIAVFSAFLYSITPQLLHGVTAFALPWVLVIVHDIFTNGKAKWLYCITFFISIFSSLIYSGYIFCGIFFFLLMIFMFQREYSKAIKSFTHGSILLVGYIITFSYTFLSIKEISSRNDWVLLFFTNDFSKSIIRYLTVGDIEVYSYFHLLIYPCLFLLILFTVISKKDYTEKKFLLCDIGLIVFIGLIAAFWRSSSGMIFREFVGGIFKFFQLNRSTMILLSLQHILLFILTILLCKYFISIFGNNRKSRCTLYVLLTITFIVEFSVAIFAEQKIGGEKSSLKKFFQLDMMNEVKEYIGKPQDSYRVVSFGYNPGVPLYNGFFCLDGYSTNYRLSYKRKWEKIISSEIAKDDSSKDYFNCWGGRVYLFSPSMKATNSEIDLPDFDYKQLENMGCDYIFSKYKFKTIPENVILLKMFSSKMSDDKLYLYAFVKTKTTGHGEK